MQKHISVLRIGESPVSEVDRLIHQGLRITHPNRRRQKSYNAYVVHPNGLRQKTAEHPNVIKDFPHDYDLPLPATEVSTERRGV